MEDHSHQKTISRDIFSFPITLRDQDSDFEFGSLTPESPTTDPYKNSPADHLFYNGKLLPHSFPPQLQQQLPASTASISGSTSRTSSRKDSLMSSRSNSVNSSRSSISCSSGRTSSSGENWERKVLYRSRKYGSVNSSSSPVASKLVMAQLYGSSQRWQHLIVPLPALKREDSKKFRSNCNGGVMEKNEKCKKRDEKKSNGFWLRFLKSLLVACRECHAMEPSTSTLH